MTSMSPHCSDPGHAELLREVASLRRKLADAEQRLADKDEIYNSLVGAMAEGVVLQEPDGTIAAYNNNALKILGLSAEQFLGQTSVGLAYRAIREDGSVFPGLEHPAMVTLRTGQPCLNVTMGICKEDGSLAWILINSMPVRRGVAGHERCCVVATFNDVTDLKRAGETLRLSESDLQEAQECAGMGSWTRDISGDITWSPELCRIYGREGNPSPLPDDRYAELFSPDSFAVLWPAVEDLLSHNKPFEKDVQLADGLTWLTARGRADLDAAGRVTRWHGTMQDITARKAVEARLAQYMAELDDLYNNAPCGYHSLDRTGRFVRINDTELAMLGYRREEVIGKLGLQDLATEQTWNTFKTNLSQFMKIGRLTDMEVELRRKDGSILPLLLQATAIRDSEGEFLISRSSVTDISERRRTEETLRASEQKYRRFVQNNPAGVARAHLDGTILEANGTLARMLGVPSYEMLAGRNLRDFWWNPADRAPLVARLRAEKMLLDYEVKLRRCDGQPVWISLTALLVEGPEGLIIEGVTLDITERKATEARLAANTSELDDLYNGSPCGYHSVDEDGTFLRMNDTELEMLGYSREEIIGKKTLYDLATEATRQRFPGNFDLLVRTGGRETFEVEFKRKDGSLVQVLVHASVGPDAQGRNISRAAVLDISRQHRLELQRLKVEAALQESERRLQLALDAADLGIWEVDLSTETAVRNLRHDQIFGYERPLPEWTVTNFLNQVVEADRDAVQRLVEEGRMTGEVSLECRIQWPDQSIHWIGVEGKASRDASGKPVRMLGVLADITERKRAAAVIQASESRYRAVVDDQSEFISRILPDGSFTFMNESFMRFFGLSDAWLGKKWNPVALPEDIPRVLAALASVSPECPVVNVENRVIAADGQTRWAHFVNRAFFDSSGQLCEFQTVGREITERKVAEAALRESEAAFRQLADAMPQIAWITDGLGRVIYMNQRWADFTGLDTGTSSGVGWSTVVHPDDRQSALETWSEAVTTGAGYQTRGRLRSTDGDYRWFLVRGVPVRDGTNNITKWFGTCTDIHDLIEAEAELRLLNDQLQLASSYNRNLLEASLDPLVTIGPNGRITDANEAAENATGVARYELIGSDFSNYFTDPERARATYEGAFRDGVVRDSALELRHRNGTVMSVLYNASVYRDAEGRPAGVFAAARDVTARRKAEEELEVRRGQLEEMVVALRNSVADKEVLLKEIHHRVKNNLQIVSSLLHMQARVTADPVARELLRESENRVQSMGAIHESLYRASDLSRVELPKYLRRVVERVADTYRQSGVICTVEGDSDVTATADIAMPCGLIVNELLSNALKHAFSGKPGRVTVTVRQGEGSIGVSVEDDGRGLPEASSFENPSGLGLQLVRALADQLTGTLRIIRGQGTRFELEIPTAQVNPDHRPLK